MQTVRRWYTYVICAISLQAVAWALIGLAWQFIDTYNVLTTAFLIAVIIVGLPIFIAHWLWAARLARSDPDERESSIRWFYLFAMLAAFLTPVLMTVFALLRDWLAVAFNRAPAVFDRDTQHSLVMLVVLGLFWLYHARMARRDTHAMPLEEANGAIRRLYLFGFSAGGLLATVWGVDALLRLLLGAIGTTPFAGRLLLSAEIARLAVGIPLWLISWQSAQRLYAGDNADERDSALRKLYLYAVIGASVSVAVTNATMILACLFRNALGLPSIGDLREPLSWIAVWAVAWAYHAVILRGDMRLGIGPRQAAVRRLYRYLIAGIALAAFLAGIIGDIATIIRMLAGEAFGAATKETIAWFSAALISGLCVWVYPWRLAQADALPAGLSGADERRSTIRKLYLYLYIFAATISVLGGAIYIVFRLLSIALGDRFSGNLLADLGVALAFIAVAVVVWLYHGAALRGDGRLLNAEKAGRQADMRVAVVDAGRGAFGQAVLAALHREFPSLALVPIGLTPEAAQAMGGDGIQAVEHLTGANLIVGPWQIAVAGAAGGAVTAAIAGAVSASAAHKLLVPVRADNWDWVGGESGNDQTLAHETARAVKQVLEGEDVKGRGASPWFMLIGGGIGICLLLQLVSALLSVVSAGMFR
ncbi:MAG: DUF3842 family protein [Chloroflexi bacterium]|nr:DUF3842 family protein [Chloroflexota bacterium]